MTCTFRSESVRAIRADHHSRTFTLTFPALPEGAVPCSVEAEFADHDSHQPSGYVLHYEVPGGRLRAPDCPVCGGQD